MPDLAAAALAAAPVALVAFDLDDTLAPSKSPLPDAVAQVLGDLLQRVPVCVISGGQYGQFTQQLLARLDLTPELAARLHLMPTCGTQYYRWDGEGFGQVYAHTLTQDERDRALTALRTRAVELGLWESETWGEVLEDRGSQVTFSALGQQAPVDAKAAWDPTGERKGALRDAVAADLPDLEVRSGGSTSVDITRRGVDKATGMRALVDLVGVPLTDMVFVGDRLDEGGNDRPVLDLGVRCHAVHGWEDTVAFLRGRLLPHLDARHGDAGS
ncbi:HAD-IIB family hydrolase [Litorihabitans aurantiacus]|uniref:HAD-IIB family hydrolase n=1 Tax=Litorihabitans aurantiacus TaxID=1930061 RepID=UPI0024E17E4D|nr:HAD-IIB family hydrolase [Litorihabitans aurantiacus]